MLGKFIPVPDTEIVLVGEPVLVISILPYLFPVLLGLKRAKVLVNESIPLVDRVK